MAYRMNSCLSRGLDRLHWCAFMRFPAGRVTQPIDIAADCEPLYSAVVLLLWNLGLTAFDEVALREPQRGRMVDDTDCRVLAGVPSLASA